MSARDQVDGTLKFDIYFAESDRAFCATAISARLNVGSRAATQ
jgi:hypothetical protein